MGIFTPLLKKLINPVELYRIINLQRNRKKVERSRDDAQLKLYSEILKGDFLHYGYFDDISINPQDISLSQIYKAQLRYAEILIGKINTGGKEIIDIGCGMGGLLKILLDKGFNPTALTPDRTQVHYISGKYKNVPVYHCKFEEINSDQHAGKYHAMITSESLQYLNLDLALPLLTKIGAPGAQWIACDYFRTGLKGEKSGHHWEEFIIKIKEYGWKLEWEQDITLNILPTIAYVHMWGNDIGMPLYRFGLDKLKVKSPGIYYGLRDIIPGISEKIEKNLLTVNPVEFAKNKRYKLLVMKRNNE